MTTNLDFTDFYEITKADTITTITIVKKDQPNVSQQSGRAFRDLTILKSALEQKNQINLPPEAGTREPYTIDAVANVIFNRYNSRYNSLSNFFGWIADGIASCFGYESQYQKIQTLMTEILALQTTKATEGKEEALNDATAINKVANQGGAEKKELPDRLKNKDVGARATEEEAVAHPSRNPFSQNILILGKSHSGKSTLAEILKDPCYTPVSPTFFSTTLNPEKHTLACVDNYQFNLLDTPGLFENRQDGTPSRPNDEIITLIQTKAGEHFGGAGFENVDTAIIAITVHHSINSNDISAMQALLPQLGSKIKKIIVITHAESFTKEERENLRGEIATHAAMKTILEENSGVAENILFSGALPQDIIGEHARPATVEEKLASTLEKIAVDREKLIEKLLPTLEPEDVKAARVAKTTQKIEQFAIAELGKATLRAEAALALTVGEGATVTPTAEEKAPLSPDSEFAVVDFWLD